MRKNCKQKKLIKQHFRQRQQQQSTGRVYKEWRVGDFIDNRIILLHSSLWLNFYIKKTFILHVNFMQFSIVFSRFCCRSPFIRQVSTVRVSLPSQQDHFRKLIKWLIIDETYKPCNLVLTLSISIIIQCKSVSFRMFNNRQYPNNISSGIIVDYLEFE